MAIASLATRGKLRFVQVGANDGKLEDPIHHHVLAHGAEALLIEPQPWLIAALRDNYAAFRGKLMIENIAIGPDHGTLSLHTLKRAFWDDYTARDGRSPTILFSPDRDLLRRRIARRMKVDIDEAERRLDTIDVPMAPLSDVLARHGMTDIDVLQVDCEGWDVKVILSLGEVRPAVIHFESLSLSDADRQAFSDWSRQNGYGCIQGWKDTLAIRGLSHPA
ncbi:FkbM family methyltransferase [Rhabdonatronobacter sediminivivens]|uniref:FkbM family methyltransferase n=1 Tax=Rhabdonatronobacter sediminivivens TaxID=2743469 RepID=UPI0015D02EC7|nr:FkbM family methyltransferase [Rhabdonatronobacter sediminivivens]